MERPTAPTLLGHEDPEPVEVLRREGRSVLFLTCEHAGRAIPRRLGTLGLDEHHLARHIAWDIGAAGVARRLSQMVDATLVLQRYSRLVVDCNRAPGAHDFVVTLSEDTEIPGNLDVCDEERHARETEIFHPYHDTIRSLLDLLARERELVVGENQPYYLTDEKDYSVPVHGERRGIPHAELEVRQDLIASESGQEEWARRIARVLVEGVEGLRDRGML